MNPAVFQVPTTKTKLYLVLVQVSIENLKKSMFFSNSLHLSSGMNPEPTGIMQGFPQNTTACPRSIAYALFAMVGYSKRLRTCIRDNRYTNWSAFNGFKADFLPQIFFNFI